MTDIGQSDLIRYNTDTKAEKTNALKDISCLLTKVSQTKLLNWPIQCHKPCKPTTTCKHEKSDENLGTMTSKNCIRSFNQIGACRYEKLLPSDATWGVHGRSVSVTSEAIKEVIWEKLLKRPTALRPPPFCSCQFLFKFKHTLLTRIILYRLVQLNKIRW